MDPGTIKMLTSKNLQTILPIIYSFIFIVSIPLNSISFWFLCRHARPRTPTIIYVTNLAITDLLYSMMLPFQVVYHMNGNNWVFKDAFCRLITVLFYSNMHCSILTMMSISVERYLGIVHPLHTKHLRTVKAAVLTCIFIWLFVLLVHTPLMYTDLTYKVKELEIVTCFDVLPKNMFQKKAYFYVYFGSQILLFFIVPLLVMGTCYGFVILTLISSSVRQFKHIKMQTVYLIILVLTTFLVCYLPNAILMVLHAAYSNKGKSFYIEYKLTLALNSLNCCFDPFVYYFASKEFRKTIQKKLCKCRSDTFTEQSSTMLS
uniref:G-protein coupled receptors family 1 profile domain-containing protein n=1 Tax=Latimeria chalumnae TaxID=7897 RepID=H3A2U6_LATCH